MAAGVSSPSLLTPSMTAIFGIHQPCWVTMEYHILHFKHALLTAGESSWMPSILTSDKTWMAWRCATAQFFSFNKTSRLSLVSQSLPLPCVVPRCRYDVAQCWVNRLCWCHVYDKITKKGGFCSQLGTQCHVHNRTVTNTAFVKLPSLVRFGLL